MRTLAILFIALAAVLCLGGSSVLAALQPIRHGGDIEHPTTTRAILTLSRAQGDMSAMMFGNVHGLKSCLALAVAATQRGWKESSATCLDPRGRAVTSYFCRQGQSGPQCRVGFPSL